MILNKQMGLLTILIFINLALAGSLPAWAAENPVATAVAPAEVTAAAPATPPSPPAETCEVTGVVADIQKVMHSPFNEAPSTLGEIEVRVSLFIQDRQPRKGKDKAASACTVTQKTEKRTYKLCSTAPVKKGDYIKAVEGMGTGSAKALNCLFDLTVIKKSAE